MSFDIRLTEQAEDDLNTLPVHIQAFLESQLSMLAEFPSRLSRPSVSPPFAPNYMLFDVAYNVAGDRVYLYVLFRYHQDETTLIINHIGCRHI